MTSCDHPEPELCDLLGKHLSGRLWSIWSGTSGLPPEKEQAYLDRWIAQSGRDPSEFKTHLPQKKKQPAPQPKKKPASGGPGTELKRIMASYGVNPSPKCDCNKRARQMDDWGAHKCRLQRETIVGWLTANARQWGWTKAIPGLVQRAAARRVINQAIEAAEQRERKKPAAPAVKRSEPRMENKPDAWSGGDWAVGITTADRGQYTLPTTVKTLQADGWQPIVFAEPNCRVDGFEAPIVRRQEPLGCWHNWYQMAHSLLDNTSAKWIMTVQDDMRVVRGARQIAERFLSTHDGPIGFLSLYTAKHYQLRYDVLDKNGKRVGNYPNAQQAEQKATRKGGSVRQYEWPRPAINRITTGSLWGACVLCFPRASLRKVLDHPKARGWKSANGRLSRPRTKNSDTCIGKVLNARKLPMFFANPSLASHIAKVSSISHGDNSGRRNCLYCAADDKRPVKEIFAEVLSD